MTELEWRDGRRIPIEVTGDGPPVLLAHGAGTSRDHPSTVLLRDALAARGLAVATFDYPYRAEGRKPPDRMPTLLAAHRAASGWLADQAGEPPVLAGRSMGGRVGSMLAAEGEPCRAVVCYAYPLHPAGKPDRLRVDHLGDLPVPMLAIQGTRDALARADLVDRHLRPLPKVTVIDLDGADHSYRVRGRSPDDVAGEVAERTVAWLGELG